MDYSAANYELWELLLQICIIAIVIIIANMFKRKISFIKNSLMPTAVIAGFVLLLLKITHVINVNVPYMEMITYHFIAIGFIALSLRVPDIKDKDTSDRAGLRSGAIIVSSYLIQGIAGLIVSIGLAYTILPDLFKASGILLPLGFGQGPGQANNTGTTYEVNWGFTGGRSFGLALAAAGYVCACVVGVIILNVLIKNGKIKRINHEQLSGSVTVDMFQSEEEIPVSESIDRFSIQFALILVVYLVTFLATRAITGFLSDYLPGVAQLVNSLLWGFNFIVGSAFAFLLRAILAQLKTKNVIKHQYQNNYLLSRISGLCFDIMIVAGIASIEIDDLKNLWLPFALMVICGAVVTYVHLAFLSKRVYKDYYYEGLISMYGMMTGTISSGVLLLREIDPNLETPAANNLVVGSSFAILFGVPMLVLIGMAPKSVSMLFLSFLCFVIYYIILLLVALKVGNKK